MAMTELGVFLLVQIEYGSYAEAGKVVGIVALAWVVVGPIVANLVDRYGQSRILRWSIALSTLGRIGLTIGAVLHQPIWVLALFAPLIPSTGSISTYTRARWSHTARSTDELNTAFSLEASLDEILFIFGPAATTILCTQVTSWAGLSFSTATLVLGGYAFISHRETEPPTGAGSHPTPTARRRIRRPRLGSHLLVSFPAVLITGTIFTAQGALFVSTDAATVAFADEAGVKAVSGPILAVFALGSLVGGVAYGSRVWRRSLASRLVWGVTLTGVGVSTFGLAPNLSMLALAMFVTGLVVAPTMAIGDGLVQALVPRNRLTEGMAWTRVGIDLGIGVGATLSGHLIERHGSGGGFVVAAVAGLFSAVVALSSWRYLSSRRRYEEAFDSPTSPGTMAP
jgi:MFS family permease